MNREQIAAKLEELGTAKQQLVTEFEQAKQQVFAKFEFDKEQLVANVNSRLGQLDGQIQVYQEWLAQLPISNDAPLTNDISETNHKSRNLQPAQK